MSSQRKRAPLRCLRSHRNPFNARWTHASENEPVLGETETRRMFDRTHRVLDDASLHRRDGAAVLALHMVVMPAGRLVAGFAVAEVHLRRYASTLEMLQCSPDRREAGLDPGSVQSLSEAIYRPAVTVGSL